VPKFHGLFTQYPVGQNKLLKVHLKQSQNITLKKPIGWNLMSRPNPAVKRTVKPLRGLPSLRASRSGAAYLVR
jgi:hypothetical protein